MRQALVGERIGLFCRCPAPYPELVSSFTNGFYLRVFFKLLIQISKMPQIPFYLPRTAESTLGEGVFSKKKPYWSSGGL